MSVEKPIFENETNELRMGRIHAALDSVRELKPDLVEELEELEGHSRTAREMLKDLSAEEIEKSEKLKSEMEDIRRMMASAGKHVLDKEDLIFYIRNQTADMLGNRSVEEIVEEEFDKGLAE